MSLLIAFMLPVLCAEPVPRFTDPARRAKLEAALPEVETLFERFWKQRGTPGLVFGVVIDGDLVLVKGYGVKDRVSNAPVTPDTVFRIASMTKSFTALAVLKLRDEGKLSLDDPASRWIPELGKLRFPTADTAPIRVRQLLTHGMGLPEDNPWGDRQLAIPDATLDQWLKQGLPFSTPPDTAYEYSNYGFALAGRVVQKASGISYRDYVEKRLLAPLGMKASTLEPSAVPDSLRATGYGRSGGEYFEIPSLAHGSFGAMGGMLVSARDLARYVAYHLSAWPPRDDADSGPVRRSSMREMQRVQRAANLRVTAASEDAPLRVSAGGYGYGLSVSRDCRFEHMVAHGGGLPGFGSYMWWLPEHGVGLFGMTNLTYTSPAPAMEQAVEVLRRTGALQPRELPPSPDLIRARDAITRLWNSWDDAQANTLAADNLFMDGPAAARRKDIDGIKAEVGACTQTSDVKPENLLRGEYRMTCQRGFVNVTFTLAPTMPPKVQYLEFEIVKPLDDNLKKAAESALQKEKTALSSRYGSCRIGDAVAGNGRTRASVRLDCDRGSLQLRLTAGEQGNVFFSTLVHTMDGPCGR